MKKALQAAALVLMISFVAIAAAHSRHATVPGQETRWEKAEEYGRPADNMIKDVLMFHFITINR